MKTRLIAVMTALLAGIATAQTTYVAKEYGFSGPDKLKAGYLELQMQNAGRQPFMMMVLGLKPGTSKPELLAALKKTMTLGHDAKAWGQLYARAVAHGGVGMTLPGQTGKVGLVLTPGRYALIAPGADGKGQPLTELGMVKLIEVVAQGKPTAMPKTDLKVPMYDFAFAFSGGLKPGKQTWEIVNNGQEPHELVMVRVRPGKTVQEAIAFMHAENPQGEPPVDFSSMVATGIVSEGQRMALEVNLQKGTYLVTCFLPALKNSKPHHDLGMEMSFEVK